MNKVAKVDGTIVSMADLPTGNERWTYARKHIVVCAVRGGLITIDDCEKRWGISPDEFAMWCAMFKTHGKKGLRVTKCQEYAAL